MNLIRINRKIAILGILLLGLSVCIGAGSRALNEAKAQTNLDNTNGTLFLPENYEGYLKLNAPADVAFSDNYIAIADKDVLYIYDRTKNSYSETKVRNEDTGTITKIGFAGERLFVAVSASSNFFYEYNFSDKNFKKLEINCSTFCISENKLYTASIGTSNTPIASYSIDDLTDDHPTANPLGALETKTTPSMTVLNEVLYCTIEDNVYYNNLGTSEAFSKNNFSHLSSDTSDIHNVQSTCAHNNAFYYTADGGIYRASFSGNSSEKAVRVLGGEGFGALTSFNGDLYCIRGTSVQKLGFNEDGQAYLTDFEIGSSSDSPKRLNNASDSARAGNLLVTADTDNKRISVYDMEKQSFTVIPTEYDPKFVATDGKIIAAASENGIYSYSCDFDGRWSEAANSPLTNGDTVKGIACIFGEIYYVSEHNRGVLGGISVLNTASNGIAANIYGDIFVAYPDGKVKRFTEETFTQNGEGEDTGITLSTSFHSLRSDFEGNLYYLDENGALFRNDEKESLAAKINAGDYVYTKTEHSPLSFALGFEDDEVYFLFGDFIVKSNAGALGFPTLGRLSNAKDIVRAGNLLVTADTGNNRVTVFDMQKHSFTVIRTDFSPTLVATDGSVIAAACGNKVYVCEELNGEQTAFGDPLTADLGTIKGIACVNGSVYYITEFGYGKVEKEDKGLVSRLEGPLEALAADANGILYVVDSNGRVRYFYEEEFIDTSVMSGGDAELTLKMPISSLRADCKGNLYYIHENGIWKNDTLFFKIDDKLLAYDDESKLISFALGFEDDEVFLLYGNRIIKTAPGALKIPYLDQSDVRGNRWKILLPERRKKS